MGSKGEHQKISQSIALFSSGAHFSFLCRGGRYKFLFKSFIQNRIDTSRLRYLHEAKSKKGRYKILSLPLIEMLKEYRKKVRSKWLFPSPYKREQDLPRDPSACRKKLAQILEHAGCKHLPFHALRHTFATQALRYGMDVKTLASTIGHENVETTVNVRNPHTN